MPHCPNKNFDYSTSTKSHANSGENCCHHDGNAGIVIIIMTVYDVVVSNREFLITQ